MTTHTVIILAVLILTLAIYRQANPACRWLYKLWAEKRRFLETVKFIRKHQSAYLMGHAAQLLAMERNVEATKTVMANALLPVFTEAVNSLSQFAIAMESSSQAMDKFGVVLQKTFE